MPTCTLRPPGGLPSRPLPPPVPPPRGEPPSEFAQLYPIIRRAARAHCGDPAAADDITQKAAIRVLELWDRFEPSPDRPNDRRAWAAAIAHQVVRNWRASMVAKKVSAIMPTEPSYLEALARHDVTAESFLLGKRLLLELKAATTPTRWTAFEMFHAEGYTCEEIGRVLGTPAGNVHRWVCDAARDMRAYLARCEAGERYRDIAASVALPLKRHVNLRAPGGRERR